MKVIDPVTIEFTPAEVVKLYDAIIGNNDSEILDDLFDAVGEMLNYKEIHG